MNVEARCRHPQYEAKLHIKIATFGNLRPNCRFHVHNSRRDHFRKDALVYTRVSPTDDTTNIAANLSIVVIFYNLVEI